MKDIKIKLKNAGKFIVLKMIRLYQLEILQLYSNMFAIRN